jgi:hypothetical protein
MSTEGREFIKRVDAATDEAMRRLDDDLIAAVHGRLGDGLSDVQARILIRLDRDEADWLDDAEVYRAQGDTDRARGIADMLDDLGVPWEPSWETASDRAVMSRSLARLEDGGFVERRNLNGDAYSGDRPAHHRTTHVRLTEAGRDLAGQLQEVASTVAYRWEYDKAERLTEEESRSEDVSREG